MNSVFNFIFKSIPLSLLGVAIKLLGLVIVPIALLFKREVKNHTLAEQYPGWKLYELPKLFSWWDNPRYGTMGNYGWTDPRYNPWFYKNPTGFLSQYYWLAIRNPGNGLYATELFSCVQIDNKITYKGKKVIDNGKYGWQFVIAKGDRTYTGLYVYLPYTKRFCLELRIGFKILPTEPIRVRPVGCTFIINPFKKRI